MHKTAYKQIPDIKLMIQQSLVLFTTQCFIETMHLLQKQTNTCMQVDCIYETCGHEVYRNLIHRNSYYKTRLLNCREIFMERMKNTATIFY